MKFASYVHSSVIMCVLVSYDRLCSTQVISSIVHYVTRLLFAFQSTFSVRVFLTHIQLTILVTTLETAKNLPYRAKKKIKLSDVNFKSIPGVNHFVHRFSVRQFVQLKHYLIITLNVGQTGTVYSFYHEGMHAN